MLYIGNFFKGTFFGVNGMSALGLSFVLLCLLGILLSLGRRLRTALLLERLGVPIALIVGLSALLIGPYGPIPVLSQSVTDAWVGFPSPLLTLVFATLMLGRPIPKGETLLKPIASQALLGLLLGFGQYLVGGIVVLLFLTPYLEVNPLMGCLIEVGFEGGHGAAAIMGDSFAKLGFPEGLDLGLAMATVGLLSSTLLGSALVVLGRFLGWVVPQSDDDLSPFEEAENQISIGEKFKVLMLNLGLAGLAVVFAWLVLTLIRYVAPFLGGVFEEVALAFPVFPLALLGSLVIRLILEKFDKTSIVSQLLQREIGILATDLLIITAMASLNLQLLQDNWIPLTVLSTAGLGWNLLGILIFARFILSEEWFERSITEFGNATGVAASGLLLLRLADPRNLTNALPVFSIKQLFLQPLLSGGIVTVIAPILITRLGLVEWTEICGLLTFIFIISSIYLQKIFN
tara:strand:- start:904 stop:2280 length:1377 start_codon:yes stop_codon:yes gene_type:complete